MALQIGAFSYSQDYGTYISFMVYLKHQVRLKIYLLKLMQKSKLQTELISDKELQNFKTSTRINM
jgi:hypothetical protein